MVGLDKDLFEIKRSLYRIDCSEKTKKALEKFLQKVKKTSLGDLSAKEMKDLVQEIELKCQGANSNCSDKGSKIKSGWIHDG